MRVISGTSSFLANNVAGIHTSNQSQIENLPEEDRIALTGKDGFVTTVIAEAEELIWQIENLTTVHSGATDKIYRLGDITEVTMGLGKQIQYLMCHPSLKRSYIDKEVDIPGYHLPNDKMGEDDPFYRAVYNGKLSPKMNGYISKQWLTGRNMDLTLNEQLITLSNHVIITNGLSDYLDYATADGKCDKDDEGSVITTF